MHSVVHGTRGARRTKKPRNAKMSHAEHPSRSDAVEYFLCILETEAYSPLRTTVVKKKWLRMQLASKDVSTPDATVQQVTEVAPPPPVSVHSSTATEPALKSTTKPKMYRHPQLLTMPSKTGIPIEYSEQQLLAYSFLPYCWPQRKCLI